MAYKQIVNWMFNQLPMYQRQGASAYKANLDNTHQLAHYLQHPETAFKTIHVAGTNGKGSTSHMLASVLQEAGYKVGLYTSPHLKDFRERIRINGKKISKNDVVCFIENHQHFFETHQVSFFEMTVGMAFSYFAKEAVDIAVIEVGLGGRLDSTNIITPEVSVITNIGIDHTQFLGNTLAAIASEKAGIIKQGVPVVIGETHEETKPVFKAVAAANNSALYFADSLAQPTYKTDLKGSYQARNLKTVLQTLKLLQSKGFKLADQNIAKGLLHVMENTRLKGRWQILQLKPKIICDTAHNAEAFNYIVPQLNAETYEQLHMVFGVVNDKDLTKVLKLLPKEATYYFCKPGIARGLAADILQGKAAAFELQGGVYESVKAALTAAKNKAQKHDLIYVGGSTFVVAEII